MELREHLVRAAVVLVMVMAWHSSPERGLITRSPFVRGSDEKLIAELRIRAPEIIHHDGQWYISDLSDFQGIKPARLEWKRDDS